MRHDSPLRQNPQLYPTLDPHDENWSPTSSSRSFSDHGSPNESFGSNRSHYIPECAPLGKQVRKEPVTPIKGSPGKRISTEAFENNPVHTHRGAAPILYIFISLVVIVCVVILHTNMTGEETATAPASKTKTIQDVHKDLNYSLRRLNLELSQPKELWVQLIGQLKSIMVDAPQQPAVLLVVMPQDSKATAVCLVHKIAEAIRDAFEGWLIVFLKGSFVVVRNVHPVIYLLLFYFLVLEQKRILLGMSLFLFTNRYSVCDV